MDFLWIFFFFQISRSCFPFAWTASFVDYLSPTLHLHFFIFCFIFIIFYYFLLFLFLFFYYYLVICFFYPQSLVWILSTLLECLSTRMNLRPPLMAPSAITIALPFRTCPSFFSAPHRCTNAFVDLQQQSKQLDSLA